MGFDKSAFGPLLPIQHVRCEVGSLSKTGPLVLDARLSHLDPSATFLAKPYRGAGCAASKRTGGVFGPQQHSGFP
jgi:hypothetical protein